MRASLFFWGVVHRGAGVRRVKAWRTCPSERHPTSPGISASRGAGAQERRTTASRPKPRSPSTHLAHTPSTSSRSRAGRDGRNFAPALYFRSHAEVAELVDALGSGPSSRKGVWVRVPPSAPLQTPPTMRGFSCPRPEHRPETRMEKRGGICKGYARSRRYELYELSY